MHDMCFYHILSEKKRPLEDLSSGYVLYSSNSNVLIILFVCLFAISTMNMGINYYFLFHFAFLSILYKPYFQRTHYCAGKMSRSLNRKSGLNSLKFKDIDKSIQELRAIFKVHPEWFETPKPKSNKGQNAIDYSIE